MKRPWFLLAPDYGHIQGECLSCSAPAKGFDNRGRKLCCGECPKCHCEFHRIQKDIASQIPLTRRAA